MYIEVDGDERPIVDALNRPSISQIEVPFLLVTTLSPAKADIGKCGLFLILLFVFTFKAISLFHILI